MKSPLFIRLSLISFLIGCTFLGGIGAWSKSYKPEQVWNKKKAELRVDNIQVRNYTSGIEVLSTKIDKQNEVVTITFKNNYGKDITGYQVAVGGGVTLTDCLTGAVMDQNIHPGEIREDHYPLQLDIDKGGIAILAVVLDDRSTDGNSKFVQEIREYRKGVKIQRKHVLQLLNDLLATGESEPTAKFNDLESRLSPFSEDEEVQYPAHVRFGLQDEKDRLLHNIEGLKGIATSMQGQTNNKKIFSEKLTSLIESYTKTLDSL